jgi:hypothetical protein
MRGGGRMERNLWGIDCITESRNLLTWLYNTDHDCIADDLLPSIASQAFPSFFLVVKARV